MLRSASRVEALVRTTSPGAVPFLHRCLSSVSLAKSSVRMAAKLSQGELCAAAAQALDPTAGMAGLVDIGANLADKAFTQVSA